VSPGGSTVPVVGLVLAAKCAAVERAPPAQAPSRLKVGGRTTIALKFSWE